MYADDEKIYRTIKYVGDSDLLQSDLNAFNDWCLVNKMFLNIDKYKVINFTRKNVSMFYSYNFRGVVLVNVDRALDLGVFIDCKLKKNLKIILTTL